MKTSKYNLFVEKDNNFYVYNQLSMSLTQVDEELYSILQETDKSTLKNILNEELSSSLTESHHICDNDLCEENIILRINRDIRYSKSHARVTILPTINCNFKCWYCYEHHKESCMTEENAKATLLFIENLIMTQPLKSFHLDWFGGEPLLYFTEIIYPIGMKVKEFCEIKGISFFHSITTNGYLVNDDITNQMNEISLRTFQITLDGSAVYHNKTRFSVSDKSTYGVIIANIIHLCRNIKGINMTVRINYTPKNLGTIEDIAYSFPEDVRSAICISPQFVWQFKKDFNMISDIVKEKMKIFSSQGYKTNTTTPSFNKGCYVENMLQYVINYDLTVHKCTARDFANKEFSIGKISDNGTFVPNANYYNYFISSHMENPDCLACHLLPSCSGMCLQKKIEHSIPPCDKVAMERSLINQIHLLIENS
jgi:uncharacterized protein